MTGGFLFTITFTFPVLPVIPRGPESQVPNARLFCCRTLWSTLIIESGLDHQDIYTFSPYMLCKWHLDKARDRP